ncbi:MAG TPA: NAD(P)/FAD-dependent oxidoreductase [Gemmatimonadaceae bacterium]|jgi:NADH dehydrogenase|nr:NAD(P)/FAD-dependent oxidoreductase [Gemmatimonadaceae bacterium]
MRKRIVIIGGGFGGLTAAKTLRNVDADITLIDRTNYHLFQPLLYQVATAALAPSDITAPIRWILRRQKNTTVLLGEVCSIDTARKTVCLDYESTEIPYDYLIVAAGSRHAYFGHEEWEPLAPGLKAIEDGTEIRRRFLLAFERAEKATTDVERDEYMTFVIVGGGPTGVELSGAMPMIARRALYPDFRRIDTRKTRVILLEGGPRILPSFPESLAAVAHKNLLDLGVEVHTNSIVTEILPDAVCVGADRFPTRTVFWAAGNVASPLGKMLGVPLDHAGRVIVEPNLSIPGHPEVFVAGDLALVNREGLPPVPGVAQGAIQGGRTAAKNVMRLMRGQPTQPFSYWNKGDLAVIGRTRAIADLGKVRFTGFFAWVFWLTLHIMYLVGFRNRLSVLVQWAYSYFTYQRGVRLITNLERHGELQPQGRASNGN